METYPRGQLRNLEAKGLLPLFLDLETTGLLEDTEARLTISGFLDEKGIHQFFAAESNKEDCLLLDTFDFLKAHAKTHFLVTYNGKYFDIPFLEKRNEIYFGHDQIVFDHIDLHEIATKDLNQNRYMAKDYCMRTLMPMYFRNTSGFRCAQIMKLPKERLYNYEKYELLYHNALDLYQTALIFEEFKRYDWL